MPNNGDVRPTSQLNANNYNEISNTQQYSLDQSFKGTLKKDSGHNPECVHKHDDDTTDDPWPESFDPMRPEKPFIPIIKQAGHINSVIEAEAHSNLRSHKRPQRNQKNFNLFKYRRKPPTSSSSRAFQPSIKGPQEFFPSMQGNIFQIY